MPAGATPGAAQISDNMRHLHIDIETYSPVGIDCGIYQYASSEDFMILLYAFSYDDGGVHCLDMTKQDVWTWETLFKDLTDPEIVKHAHNAAFERVCFTMAFRRRGLLREDEWLDPAQWECSMVQCARCGLPLSLEAAGAELRLTEQKMAEGKNLIKLFSVPDKYGQRQIPEMYPDEWSTFMDYCIRDVEVEKAIMKATAWLKVSTIEQELYAVDQTINDHGAAIDTHMVDNAIRMDGIYRARLNMEAMKLSGLENPQSNAQFKAWLEEQTGQEIESVSKKKMPDVKGSSLVVDKLLELRSEIQKTSVKKYYTIRDWTGKDGRIRGVIQHHGTRTGRWAGRGPQFQNLPQNHIPDLDFARSLVVEGDLDMVEMCYGKVEDTLSQLLRTTIVAPEGKTLAVCDFSAIEARVLAWLAGEGWVLDTFREGGDIYCATASQMFGVPVEKHGPNAELRQRGKVAVLALGYGGGEAALEAMGGKRLGLTKEEMTDTVKKWRQANPHIVELWGMIERATIKCVREQRLIKVNEFLGVKWNKSADTLTFVLPSGREVSYRSMRYSIGSRGKLTLSYMGQDQKSKKWMRIDTWGGKLTENVVQAIARDCLRESMLVVNDTEGLDIVFHVHDELVTEAADAALLKTMERIFARDIRWAPGLPLKGAGYTTPYYIKD